MLRFDVVFFCVVFTVLSGLSAAQQVCAIEVSAKSAVLIEQKTGRIIYAKNADEKLPMASTTKIMTAICAIENGDLSQMIEVDNSAVGVEGSSMYLEKGESLSLENLIYGLMLSSGNDAAVAIAIAISGDIRSFAALMNETAAKIGATNTSFENPNGLDGAEHYTTSYDLALITRYAMFNEKFCEIVKTIEKRVPWQGRDYDRVLRNHNKMLKIYNGADGVKTGFTKKSGRCLVSSATRDDLSVIAVTLNAPDDWNDHTRMLDFAFDNFCMRRILKKGDYIRTQQVKNSVVESIKIVSDKDVFVPTKKDEPLNIKLNLRTPSYLEAPVGFEDAVGGIEVYVDGVMIDKVTAITTQAAPLTESKKFSKSFRKIVGEWMSFKTQYLNY